jgi:hypothetical protein
MPSTPEQIHRKLASMGIRVFKMAIGDPPRDQTFWMHHSKTVEDWRKDVSALRGKLCHDENGWASDTVLSALYDHLRTLGYIEMDDVVADVFEGRVACEVARLADAPEHENQSDGFGHYGWESKPPPGTPG